jgi:WD40 repeat protein/serine/threonine protein kinase
MAPQETTPIDDGLLDALLSADAAIGARSATRGSADESWVRDCLRLLELIRPPAELPAPDPGATRDLPLLFGRFELLREVGRGGFGVVYLARDPVLSRPVALKVPRPEMLVTPEARKRFTREAHAAAVLDHPNIVPVHEAGEIGSIAYIVSSYCEGPSLSEWLKARHQPVPARAAAQLIATLGHALEHAHERGILHRDLKPSNVMLQATAAPNTAGTEFFDFVPRVADFGLAKLTADEGDLTHTGAPIGSPPYMAPEQAAGRLRDLGPATDVYALGATLYEVLTGRAPFRGETPAETIRQVIDDEPIAPRVLRPGVDADLETICLRCLNKDASRRYPSAAALAVDLERLLAGQPIHARPASLWERSLKWARRRPALAAAAALAVIVTCGAAGGLAWSNSWLQAHNERLKRESDRADRHAEDADRQRQIAVEREELTDRHLHAAQLRLASQACDVGQFERAQEVLLDDVYGPGPRHLDFAWRYLWRVSRREVALLGHHPAPVRRIELSPDGRTLASGDAGGGVLLWDTSSRRCRATLSGHARAAEWLAFSPDGTLLASCGDTEPVTNGKKELLLWDVATGQLRSRPEGAIANDVRLMAFLDRGRLLAVVTRDAHSIRTIRVWDLASGTAQPKLRYQITGLGSVMAAPDGKFVAVREADARLTLRDPASGGITRTIATDLPDVRALAVSANGRSLAAALPSKVFVWDLHSDGAPRIYSDDEPRADRLVFSPDGSTLAVVSGAWQVSVRDLATGKRQPIASLDPARVGTFDLAFSPDGKHLALRGSGLPGGTIPMAIWRVATGEREKVFPGRRSFQYICFATDGASLYLGGDHDLSVWKPQQVDELNSFPNHHDEVWTVAFSPDGETVLSGGNDRTLRLWDPETGRELITMRGHNALVSTAAFRPDGSMVASGSFDARENINLWDAANGQLIRTLAGHTDRVRSVSFAPDGDTLASAGSDRTIRLWDVLTGDPRGVLIGHDDAVRQVAFSPDGLTLASAGNDRTLRLWDVRTGRRLAAQPGRYPVSATAFAPDGLTLASADESGFITLWDRATMAPRRVINGDDEEVRALAFSPDGRALASAGASRTIRVWDPVTGQELLTISGSLGQVNALAFSPDGDTLVSADHGGFARIHRGITDSDLPPIPPGIGTFAPGAPAD